jgi:hypothetical protein
VKIGDGSNWLKHLGQSAVETFGNASVRLPRRHYDRRGEYVSHSKKNDHKRTQVMKSARYSCQISIGYEFTRQFSKNPQMSNFMKIRPVGAETV